MTTISKQDAINAAASVATDVAEGRLSPVDLERQAVSELTELVGTVAGPGDPLWDLQVGIARQVLAAGGIDPNELAEWTAVGRRRENPDAAEALEAVAPTGVVEPPQAPNVPTEADTASLEPYGGESAVSPADPEPVPTDPSPGDRRVIARGRGLPTDNGLRPL